jgi:VCBS repeat-containing protein
VNIKVLLKYVFLLLISVGLAACHDANDVNEVLTYADNAVTFSGDSSGSINEDDATVTGTITVSNGSIVTQTDVAQTYGSFSIDSAGAWTYTLDNANNAVQALNAGVTVTESISIESSSGNTTNITITITGVNDDAVIGGVDTGSTVSNVTAAVTGALTLTGDVDTDVDTFVAQSDAATSYGAFSIDEAGEWSYSLDTANADVAALTSTSDPLTDVIAVTTADGLMTNVTITIDGPAANTPATFGGDTTGSIDAGDMATLTGTVSVTDPDMGEAVVTAQTSTTLTYGSFSIGADGAWSYVLDNNNADVQALTTGDTLTEDAAITSADGTMGTVTITINGVAAGPTTQVIIDDSFADGDRTSTGTLDADWWSSSSTSGNSVEISAGALGLVTGTSGRGMHATFAPQTLAEGESLTVTYSFTTPATIGLNKGTAFKIALMDFNDAGLAADLSSSSSSVNPLYVGQPGYFTAFDVDDGTNTAGSEQDTEIRKHDVAAAGGRFLGTTGEWDSISSSADADYAFTANTDYVGVFTITRTGADSVDIFGSLSQGGTLLDSHMDSDTSAIANNFGMLGFWVNSNTFGSTTSSDPDNGLTFTNVLIEKE